MQKTKEKKTNMTLCERLIRRRLKKTKERKYLLNE